MFGTKETGSRDGPTRGELQDDLMRFEGRFSSRLVTAFAPLVESPDPAIRLRASRDELGFISSALDIAVGSSPEVDLLDMVTLVALGLDAMSRRWNLDACGESAHAVAEAFRASVQDISAVASAAISGEVRTELEHVIREWQGENPGQDDVTSVRLSAYAKYRAGSSADSAGLFALLRGATQTADTAVLLGDRALYATQRLPYLVRLHVQIAGREIIAEARSAAKRSAVKGLLTFGGLALVGGTSWLVARAAYRRLAPR
jgi:hypothetical protein